jgi:hypothetical protein
MTRTRFKKVLLISPEISSHQYDADYEKVKHIHAINRIFPSIFEEIPNLIIFDCNYVGKDMEDIIRRIRTNSFYNKIKICCYKTKPEIKADGLLKAIGVDFFIYDQEFKAAPVSTAIPVIFTEILDLTVLAMLPNASN